MNNKYLTIFILPLFLMIAGCDLGVKQEYEISDAELIKMIIDADKVDICLLYTSPSPRDATLSRMPSSA